MSTLDRLPEFTEKRIFGKLFKIAEVSKLTKDDRRIYESNLKAKWDYENSIAFASAAAAASASAEAVEDEKQSTAKKLKALGMPLNQIMEVTSLSLETIENL